MLGKVESVSTNEDTISVVLSVPAILVEIPKSEAKFEVPEVGKKVAILRTKQDYRLIYQKQQDSYGST